MKALWEGRFGKALDPSLDSFNSSLPFDSRMYRQDLRGSRAHARMLCQQGLLSEDDLSAILRGLSEIEKEIDAGTLAFTGAEDIHSFVETQLTARIGDAGKRLHTARSRNDQVALDLRLWLLDEIPLLRAGLSTLTATIARLGEQYKDAIMPGYTHLQRGQPVSFGHHILAYAQMLLRDLDRFSDCGRRAAVSPLGSCALAGTTVLIDRFATAQALGLSGPCQNSIDGVSDRDFAIEFAACCATAMMHLSRLAEELILWSSWEFRFLEPDDSCATGSSIMPQKKNPDLAELARGKTGRVYGDLMALLTVMKGLPLAYDKDMQEDKEPVFDCADTLAACLHALNRMLATMTVRTDVMERAARQGFINATDCADYLAGKGMPFRDAYKLTGALVSDCIREGVTLEELPLSALRARSQLFAEDYYAAIDLRGCMQRRGSFGGTSPESVLAQVAAVRAALAAAE